MKLRFLFITALLAGSSTGVFAQDNCPYLPAFKSLRTETDAMTATNAVAALQKYVAENDNAEGCELIEIDQLLGKKEAILIKLAMNGKEIPAQVVFRCNKLNPKTAQCQSPMEDDTAHARAKGISPMSFPPTGSAYQVISTLPAAEFLALYRISLADALDGKTAKRLSGNNTGKWQLIRKASALIAIYKTQGPWAYRKAVWYFE